MTSLKKDTTPEPAYRQRFFEQSVKYKHFEKIFTDGSLKGEKAAAAAVSNKFQSPHPTSSSKQKFSLHCWTKSYPFGS